MATQKVVLMTGSSQGIGLATAERLAKDPQKRFLVIATVISFAEKDNLVSAVGHALDKTVFIKELDVTKDDQIKIVVNEVITEHGKIDILLNIAGIFTGGLIETISRDRIELTFNINTIAVIRLTQAVLPQMKQQREGEIITVTSEIGRLGTPFCEVYCSSKFAAEGFMEALAPVCRQFNIRVSLVEPTITKTDLARDVIGSIEFAMTASESHRPFSSFFHQVLEGMTLQPPSLVVDKILEIIEAEKPVLRYPVPADIFDKSPGDAILDLTGERQVARGEGLIGCK